MINIIMLTRFNDVYEFVMQKSAIISEWKPPTFDELPQYAKEFIGENHISDPDQFIRQYCKRISSEVVEPG